MRGVPRRNPPRLCTYPGCTEIHAAKGLCRKHYHRQWYQQYKAKQHAKKQHAKKREAA